MFFGIALIIFANMLMIFPTGFQIWVTQADQSVTIAVTKIQNSSEIYQCPTTKIAVKGTQRIPVIFIVRQFLK